jgi:hypothetical protein
MPRLPTKHIFASLLMATVGGCAADSRCADAAVYVAMSADQALPILQACGKLSGQDAFGTARGISKIR